MVPLAIRTGAGRATQDGLSLIMVLRVLVLVGLTAVSASRSSLFNEAVTGNEADYSRTLSAAEALIRDAQLDILGVRADGTACQLGAGFVGCRVSPTGLQTGLNPFFPQTIDEAGDLANVLAGVCVNAICFPQNWPVDGLADGFWLNPTQLQAARATAATYGQHSGAAPAASGNPILSAAGANARGWYWTELIVFSTSLCTDENNIARCINKPSQAKPFVYRITAVALGRGGAPAVIQQYFVPYP